jgi:hypothetical protein
MGPGAIIDEFAVAARRQLSAQWFRRSTAQLNLGTPLSIAETATLTDRTVCYRICLGHPICSHKSEFSFLNSNLMVPTSRPIIFSVEQ